MNAEYFVLLVVVLYVATGVVHAWRYHQGGQGGAAVAALLTWPLLVGSADSRPPAQGPYAAEIRRGRTELRAALAEPSLRELVSESEVQAIERALAAADTRVGTVDRLLVDPRVEQTEEGRRLRQARQLAAAEIEAVLAGLVSLRVQLGLVALLGDTRPVRDRLAELSARLGALDEVGRME